MKTILILFFFFMFFASMFGQSIHYVSTNTDAKDDPTYGSDSLHPWKTLSYAESHATNPGDTIALRAGDTFSLPSGTSFYIRHGGTASNYTVWDGSIWGVPGNKAILQNTSADGPTMMIGIESCSYLKFQNIIIDGGNLSRWAVVIGAGTPSSHHIDFNHNEIRNIGNFSDNNEYALAIILRPWYSSAPLHDINVSYNYIHDVSNGGINLYPWRSHLEGGGSWTPIYNIKVDHNTIERFALSKNYGNQTGISVHGWVYNSVFEYNVVSADASGAGICFNSASSLDDPSYYPYNDTVRYNKFYSSALPAIASTAGDLAPMTFYYYGNLIYRTGTNTSFPGAIRMQGGTTGALYKFHNNTIITDIPYGAARLLANGDSIYELKNNIFYNSGTGYFPIWLNYTQALKNHENNLYYRSGFGNQTLIYINDGTNITNSTLSSWENGSIDRDPLFPDVPSSVHLQAGSPAIGKGVPIEGYTEDLEGAPVGVHPNLGCYETLAEDKEPEYVRSIVEDATPGIIEIFFDLYLNADSIPPATAFTVIINGSPANIDFVQVSGTKVSLTLENPIKLGDNITISYSKPSTKSIRSVFGRVAPSFSNKQVTNNLIDHSIPPASPVVVLEYESTVYAGFTGDINASASFDPQDHAKSLSFSWDVVDSIPISLIDPSDIQFLAPMVTQEEQVNFFLSVSNGDSITTKDISINILPYHPELSSANLSIIEASDSALPHIPFNILDHNPNTWWAAYGREQWITLYLKKAYLIHHFEISFQPGQKRNSFFDIYGSQDSSFNWQPLYMNLISCNYSGKTQVFPSDENKSTTAYKFIKLVGKGNSQDPWNTFSEINIRGTPRVDSLSLLILPNPTNDFIQVKILAPPEMIENPEVTFWILNILNISGDLVFQKRIPPENTILKYPLQLNPGVYILQLITGPKNMQAQKLIIIG